jgi:hypothetical protein
MSRPADELVDPEDPRAPSAEVWAGLDAATRARVVAALPNEVPEHLLAPAGDWHSETRASVQEVLRRYYGRIGRRVYVSGEMNVYYPGEPAFAPDLLAVLDVEQRRRRTWVVSHEGRGLDFALEIHDAGRWTKDYVRNVAWYARLGIREYFVFHVTRSELTAHRLREGASTYTRLLPQGGRFLSEVLGVDFLVDGEELRVAARAAGVMLDAPTLLPKIEAYLDEALERAAAAERARQEAERAQEEAERAQEEAVRAQEEAVRAQEEAVRAQRDERHARERAEAEVAELRARLAALESKPRG